MEHGNRQMLNIPGLIYYAGFLVQNQAEKQTLGDNINWIEYNYYNFETVTKFNCHFNSSMKTVNIEDNRSTPCATQN